MKPKAIIYCSKHGYTKKVAEYLGKKHQLPVISLQHISTSSFSDVPVWYCGWIRNGKVVGLDKANRYFMCVKIIGVGCFNESASYTLKLKYNNEIGCAEFQYIQSTRSFHPTFIEKCYLALFETNLLKEKQEVYHEYTI